MFTRREAYWPPRQFYERMLGMNLMHRFKKPSYQERVTEWAEKNNYSVWLTPTASFKWLVDIKSNDEVPVAEPYFSTYVGWRSIEGGFEDIWRQIGHYEWLKQGTRKIV